MIEGREQRWRNGREVWAHGEPLRIEEYGVEQVTRDEAKSFVVTHHYSHTFASCVVAFGLYRVRPGAASLGILTSKLVGVCAFGNPCNESVIPKWTGCGPREGLELTRLVLDDDQPYTAESAYVSRVMRQLPRYWRDLQDDERRRGEDVRPDLKGIVSYSDPFPRRTIDGVVFHAGHIGNVYKALSALYHGRGKAREILLGPDGRTINERALSKLKKGDKGAAYAERQIMAQTGIARRSGESSESYVARVLASDRIRRMKHPGNHVYTWALTNEARRAMSSKLIEPQPGEGGARLYERARADSVTRYPREVDQDT